MFDKLLKELGLDGQDYIIYVIFAILAILIFLLFIYFISGNSTSHSSCIGRNGNSPRTKNRSMRPDTQIPVQNQFNKPSVRTPIEERNLSGNVNDVDPYIAILNKQRNSIQQSKNDDGSVRTEINFDSSGDDLKTESFIRKYEYLETANNGIFRKLFPSDEKSFFRTWVEDGIRKFEFHGNIDKALANLNAIFDDVCEIEGKQNGATNIINIEPGILDGHLKVEIKAKIKLT